MRPGVARKYLEEVSKDFEAYARTHYLGAVCRSEIDQDTLLAGVRYVATRQVDNADDHEACIRDILGTRGGTRDRREMDAACVDALVRKSADLQTAQFLALVASDRRVGRDAMKLIERSLVSLGPIANTALLDELAQPHHDQARLRKLTRLLVRTSGVPPPISITKWIRADVAERAAVIRAWRAAIEAEGLLYTPPPEEEENHGGTEGTEEDTEGAEGEGVPG